MNTDSRFLRMILASPWFLLIFLIFPLLVILRVTLHIPLPIANPTNLLLANNACFALLAAVRLLWYISRTGKAIRYGSGYRPRRAVCINIPRDEAQRALTDAGYTFTADGTYGEKRDFGYFGTMAFYAGLLTLLSVGVLDNLQKFSGTLLDGMGPATRLNRIESYRSINKGLFAASLDSLPRIVITKQVFPDSNLPKGATEVSLFTDDGVEQKRILVPGNPIRSGNFDIYMTKLVFEPQLVIKSTDSKVLFDELVKLDPLVQKRGVYSFYGVFQGYGLGGGVYYQPEKSSLMVVVTRGDKKVVSDLVFQVDKQITQGDYIISCAKMGQWSEIRVVHRRHKGLLMVGGVIAAIGLLLRIAICPQRVWLAEDMVWVVGNGTKKILHRSV